MTSLIELLMIHRTIYLFTNEWVMLNRIISVYKQYLKLFNYLPNLNC